jgi:hypothetical protein
MATSIGATENRSSALTKVAKRRGRTLAWRAWRLPPLKAAGRVVIQRRRGTTELANALS